MSGLTQDLARAAAAIVEQATASPVQDAVLIRRGVMTFKFRVATASGDGYAVRFYPESRAEVTDYEPDLLRRCAAQGVPVPEVVADSRAGPAAPLPYLLYRWLEGVPLDEWLRSYSGERPPPVRDPLLDSLRQIVKVRFNGFGELSNAWNARASSWPGFLRETLQAGAEAVAEHRLLDPATLRDVTDIVDTFEDVPQLATSHLAWMDIKAENIIVDRQGDLVGLIDFEGSIAGDPLLVLGGCHAVSGDQGLFGWLAGGWPTPLTQHEWNKVHLFSILQALRVGRYAHLPLPTGLPRLPLPTIFPGLLPAVAKLKQAVGPSVRRATS